MTLTLPRSTSPWLSVILSMAFGTSRVDLQISFYHNQECRFQLVYPLKNFHELKEVWMAFARLKPSSTFHK